MTRILCEYCAGLGHNYVGPELERKTCLLCDGRGSHFTLPVEVHVPDEHQLMRCLVDLVCHADWFRVERLHNNGDEYAVRVEADRLYIDLNTLVSEGIGQPADSTNTQEDQ